MVHLPYIKSNTSILIALACVCITFYACTKVSSTDAVVQSGKQVKPIRGVWLTNIASDVLNSRENIKNAVSLCDSLGFNTIFVVTWNRAHTLFPSEILKAITGTTIDPQFAGRDPLQELIEEAKPFGIQVHAWFEFGFSCSYKDSTGGPLIKANPHWASRDKHGKITEKNGFQWLNPFHPEVQHFMKSLILEAVNNYDLDGIQGDDRLPALPSNGGYDDYTVQLYKQENKGAFPPDNEKDHDWIKWRSAKLNQFLYSLVADVRKADPDIMISMAPSIYPWSEENYLQDWPTWIANDLVDVIIPQIYRYDIKAYENEMNKILNHQLGNFNKSRFFPGILLQVDDYNPDLEMLIKTINFNREHGVEGEVYFFYEGIKKYKPYFKQIYTEDVKEVLSVNK